MKKRFTTTDFRLMVEKNTTSGAFLLLEYRLHQLFDAIIKSLK